MKLTTPINQPITYEFCLVVEMRNTMTKKDFDLIGSAFKQELEYWQECIKGHKILGSKQLLADAQNSYYGVNCALSTMMRTLKADKKFDKTKFLNSCGIIAKDEVSNLQKV